MSDTVLFVDDDEYILNSIDRLLAHNGIDILRAANAKEALDFFSKLEIAVIVSDNQMPGMKGTELLAKVKEISPDTLKILMTAYGDLAVAVDAINKGEVFRFITKPWDDETLVQTVKETVNRYQIIQSLKKNDESILLSLAQTIELKDAYTRGHCERVAEYALLIADALGLPDDRKKDLLYGSWLHDCGKIGIPESILNKKAPLEHEEFEIIKHHPGWGADVVRQARLSEAVIKIILHHHERYDGSGYPAGLEKSDIPLEARIVSVADVFDALTSDRPYRKKYPEEKAIDIMHLMKASVLDPEIVDFFLANYLKVKKATASPLA
ncbi:MAG: HD domain-containing protein [Nitrospirae bacterium]|nr:HD domain-containing protein [Nitrospirota bacterium]